MFNEDIWKAWKENELKNYKESETGQKEYKKKGYLHLDPRFWFPKKNDEILHILQNGLYTYNASTKRNEYYSFSPFLKILTKTPRYRYQFEEGHYDLETKIRPICYAAHKDSLIMSYYSYTLTRKYEEYIKQNDFDDVVLAYRSDLGKCNIQFAKEVFDEVKMRRDSSAVALDIKGFFDHIDHSILLEKWEKVLGSKLEKDQKLLYKVLTRYSYINSTSIFKKYKGPAKRNDIMPSTLMEVVPGQGINEKFKRLKKDQLIVSNSPKNGNFCGIPQGSPMSAILSNIFLIDFDSDLKMKSKDEGFVYRRYCDDILIICDTKQASTLMDYIIDKISNEYHLTIQPSKVDIIDFHKNSTGKFRGFKRPRRTRNKIGEKASVRIKETPAITTSLNEEKYYRPLQYLGFEYNGKSILIRSSSLSRFFRKLNYRLERTVIMAHSPKSKEDQIFLKQIYERYTHLGQRNFLRYAYNAAKEVYVSSNGEKKDGMGSPSIRKQLRNHFQLLRYELARKNLKWFTHKLNRKKKITPRYFK